MDFSLLPPEIVAALIHSGPGPGSLTTASAAWADLSASLDSAADGWRSIAAQLGGVWTGPSAESMQTAAARYVSWLRSTAEQTLQFSAAASAAAAEFTTTQAVVTTPIEVASNRIRLAVLIATNLFGQNTAAIAECEAEYAAMWARNTTAMISYQTQSQTATSMLTTIPAPTPIAGAATAAAAPQIQALSLSDLLGPGSQVLAGGVDGLPISLLQVLAATWTAQGTNSTASSISDLSTGLSEGFAALGTPVVNPAFGALSMSAITPTPVTAAMGAAVPVGGVMAPTSAANIKLVSTATPLTTTPDFAGPIVAPPMLSGMGGRKPVDKAEPRKWKTGREIHGVVMPRPPSGG